MNRKCIQVVIVILFYLFISTEEASYQTSDASKVPWSDEETHNLIDIWGKDSVQRSLKDCARNRHIFNLISKKMYDTGFARTAEQCHTRIKRLKMSFRQCHEKWVHSYKHWQKHFIKAYLLFFDILLRTTDNSHWSKSILNCENSYLILIYLYFSNIIKNDKVYNIYCNLAHYLSPEYRFLNSIMHHKKSLL